MKILFIMLVLLVSCGKDEECDTPPAPAPVPGPGPSPGDAITYAQVAPIIQQSCSGGSCHNQADPPAGVYLADYAGLKSNAVRGIAAVEAGRMPKGGKKISRSSVALLKQWAQGGFKR